MVAIHILLLILITISFSLPFIDKAVHIDDISFLDLGRILNEGLDVYLNKTYYYFGLRFENVINTTHSPLGVPLFNSLIYSLKSEPNEKVFHLFFIIFPILAIVFTYFYFKRFSKAPFVLSLLVLLSPPFLVLSHNLMSDICFFSFLTGSFVFYIRGVDKGSLKCIFVSSFLFAISIAFSFQSVVFYPVFYFYSRLNNKNNRYFICMFVSVIPVATWFLYHYLSIDNVSNVFNVDVFEGVDKSIMLKNKLIYYLANLCLAFISPVILFLYGCEKRLLSLYLLCLLISLSLFAGINDFFLHGYSVAQKIVLLCSFFMSIYVILYVLYILARTLMGMKKNPDTLFLSFWFIYFFVVCIAFTPFGANRYMLPLLPPLLILLSNKISFKKPIYLFVFLMALFSSRVAVADYNYADLYRSFARDMKNNVSTTGTVWFTGEWGFRYYMREEGYKYLTYDSLLKKNDVIIKPELTSHIRLDKLDILLNLEKEFEINKKGFLRILNEKSKAGFYSQAWGFLPFWPGDNPLERIRVYKVTKASLLKTADQSYHNTPAGEIAGNNIIGQTFKAGADDLSVIKIFMASYNRSNSPDVIFHLRSSENKLEDIAKIVVPASTIKDNTWYSFSFPSLPDSKGKKYYFYLESPNAVKGNAFTAWMSSKDKYEGGTFMRNHLPEKGDLTFVALASKKGIK